ncbi:MAG: purine-nucleoside phosphorylase, partial [Deltaproteobacteria bacterium]|nr:purine-nucleoside phosphorylase [Deltaproteobacteria bacterium]
LTPQEVVFPYFVLKELGAKLLVTTNAVGGIRKDLDAGDIMVVEDQINMMGTSPLIGLTVQRSENQFLSMQKAFDPELIALTSLVAKKQKIKLKKGVFLGTTGPNYETPAEIKAFRNLGADSIGMSTIFEVITARFLNLRVLALNIITNPSADRHTGEMKHAEVLSAMQKAEAKVLKLLEGIFNQLCQKILK